MGKVINSIYSQVLYIISTRLYIRTSNIEEYSITFSALNFYFFIFLVFLLTWDSIQLITCLLYFKWCLLTSLLCKVQHVKTVMKLLLSMQFLSLKTVYWCRGTFFNIMNQKFLKSFKMWFIVMDDALKCIWYEFPFSNILTLIFWLITVTF